MNTSSPCSVCVLPDPRRKRAVVTYDAPSGTNVSLNVDDADCEITHEDGAFTITFADPQYWSPESPHVYRAVIDFQNTKIEFPVGLREFLFGNERFRLNERPIPIRGAVVPDGDQVDSGTVDRAIALGFNAIRVHYASITTELLTKTDEEGVLVFVSVPDDALDRVESIANAFFNHPSFVAWHVRNQSRDSQRGDRLLPTIEVIRAVDSTRFLVVDGLNPDGVPRVATLANPNCIEAVGLQLARILAMHPVPATTLEAAAGFGAAHLLTIAEVGRPAGVDASAMNDIVRKLRQNERIAAYWLEDAIPAEIAASAASQSASQPARPLIEFNQRSLLPREETAVRVEMANDAGHTGRGELSLQVVGPTGQVLWKKKRGVTIPKAGKELWSGTVGASGKPGEHRFVVRLLADRRVLAEDAVVFHVLPDLPPTTARVHVVGHLGETFKSLRNVTDEMDVPVYIIPPLANTIWSYPAETVCEALARVQDGAVAIVLAPPPDWNELASCFDSIPQIESLFASFAFAPVQYDTVRHPVLEGVRTGDTMDFSFERLRLNELLGGDTDEIICTSKTPVETRPPLNDIIIRAFGEGKIVFVAYDLFASADDSASENLLRNLVEYANRRAVPGEKPPPFQRAIERWRKRAARLQQWYVLGPFRTEQPLPAPPAHPDDIAGTHEGAYHPVVWRRWWSPSDEECTVDLAEACQRDTARMFGSAGLTGYAAHTFRTPSRESRTMRIVSPRPTRAWFNGRLLGSTAEQPDNTIETEITTREGVNTITIETTGDEGHWSFLFSMNDD